MELFQLTCGDPLYILRQSAIASTSWPTVRRYATAAAPVDSSTMHSMVAGTYAETVRGENVLMNQDPSCVGQSRMDVIGLQTRVFSQDITLRNALGQHTHDELHWDASPPDDRFAQHKLGI
jgi:hypothetical protein